MSELSNDPVATSPSRDQIEQRFEAVIAETPGILVDPSTVGRMVDQYQSGYNGQPFRMRQRQDVKTERQLMMFGYLLGVVDRPVRCPEQKKGPHHRHQPEQGQTRSHEA